MKLDVDSLSIQVRLSALPFSSDRGGRVERGGERGAERREERGGGEREERREGRREEVMSGGEEVMR